MNRTPFTRISGLSKEGKGKSLLPWAVKAQYEAFPYPGYSLFFPLRWVGGILGSSLYGAFLAMRFGKSWGIWGGGENQQRKKVLILGCGDTQGVMAGFYEPLWHDLFCLDLSGNSIKRSRWRQRLWGRSGRKIRWIHEGLESFLDRTPPHSWHHMDAFGVFHHLEDPQRALKSMAKALVEGGTARLMVYNQKGRRWIREVQHILNIAGWRDYPTALKGLHGLCKVWPKLKDRLEAMPLKSSSHFVDTFLHPREISWKIQDWAKALEESGLRVMALWDRFGQWQTQQGQAIIFPGWDVCCQAEEHLSQAWELYLVKDSHDGGPWSSSSPPFFPTKREAFFGETWRWYLSSPPSFLASRSRWHSWIEALFSPHSSSSPMNLEMLPVAGKTVWPESSPCQPFQPLPQEVKDFWQKDWSDRRRSLLITRSQRLALYLENL